MSSELLQSNENAVESKETSVSNALLETGHRNEQEKEYEGSSVMPEIMHLKRPNAPDVDPSL